jgi:hypothetical protein
MAFMRRLKGRTPPEGWDAIEASVEDFETQMRDAVAEDHEGKRRNEMGWRIHRVHFEKNRFIHDLMYKQKAMSRELVRPLRGRVRWRVCVRAHALRARFVRARRVCCACGWRPRWLLRRTDGTHCAAAACAACAASRLRSRAARARAHARPRPVLGLLAPSLRKRPGRRLTPLLRPFFPSPRRVVRLPGAREDRGRRAHRQVAQAWL